MMKEEINPQIRSEDVHQDLFEYLPSEIMLNILLRIPTRTVMKCKCICKAWRDLLKSHEFVMSHLSKSVPGLAFYLRGENSKRYKIVEFVDDHRLNTVFSFDLPFISCYDDIVHRSANGLLFVCNQEQYENPVDLFICNPITREYITIPSLKAFSRHVTYYGFGVSKMSGQYKVVRISVDVFDGCYDCQVYTVGSGSWRITEFHHEPRYTEEAFLNGNLHWLAHKEDLICCLDLETERFSTFSPPPGGYHHYNSLSVLGDYLCVCKPFYESGMVRGIDIWLMKEYGDEKSWTKQFHFNSAAAYSIYYHLPIKVLGDGYILMMQLASSKLVYCSKKHVRETIKKVDLFKDDHHIFATIYAPSFLSLKTFGTENVSSF